MKYLILFALMFSLNVSAQGGAVKSVTIQTSIYCDHCLECETCGGHFNKKLLREKGVQMVTVDQEAMTVKVVYNSKKVDVNRIRQAISNIGYDADHVKSNPDAYALLDECCKKQ